MEDRRIVFIGAAGEMCRVAVERFGLHASDWRMTLTDIAPEGLADLVAKLPPGRATAERVDLFDPVALRAAIDGAALVVLGAGPYLRTAEPVMEACLEARVPYLDFDDDVESTEHALAMHDRFRDAGVPCYIGCGASPGMTNVLAVDAASQLDAVETLDLCWVTGDEGARPYGRAVIEHLMHIAAGSARTWADGGPATHETWVETEVFPMGGGIGDHRLYETAHPEAVTVPRRYPEARRIRVMGGLAPQPVNGIVRGIGLAVERGRMTLDEAVHFLNEVMHDRNGTAKGWRHALGGMLGQVRRRESSLGTMLGFLVAGARKQHPPYQGSLLVRATGTRGGRPATAIRRTPVSGPDTYLWRDMAAITGTSCAAFMALALDRGLGEGGVFSPEDWAEPAAFYAALERVGAPRAEIVETVDGTP